jgi:cold shock CspA family protein
MLKSLFLTQSFPRLPKSPLIVEVRLYSTPGGEHMHGTIEKVIYSHGFGLIRADNGQRVFFHGTDTLGIDFDRLKEGQRIEFFLPHKAPDVRKAVIVRPCRRHTLNRQTCT